MNSKYLIPCLLVVSLGFLSNSFGEYQNVKSEKRFLRTVRNPKFNLSIALFYDVVRKRVKDPAQRQAMEIANKRNRATKDMFKEASKIFRYDDADLIFLAINIGKKRSEDIAATYGVRDVPTFILFKDGLPYKDASGQIIKITGHLERPQLEKFIDNYFSKSIEKNRKRNQEIRKIKIQQSLARPYWGWGGYWGWGYPYGGWGYPYYGGYWGGRCGYRGWRGRCGYRGGFRGRCGRRCR